MKSVFFLFFLILVSPVWASEISPSIAPSSEIERARKRLYPGGRDEEDLKVLALLPEAGRKTDERAIQKEVYKKLYDQELSEEAAESNEPETEH